jgi:CRISPR system Cascade subunit CasB
VKNGNMPFGKAAGECARRTHPESMEKRFLALLDADADQLPQRLRRMCMRLREYPVNFASLLDGLLVWNAPGMRTQMIWARDFYAEPAGAAVEEDAYEKAY